MTASSNNQRDLSPEPPAGSTRVAPPPRRCQPPSRAATAVALAALSALGVHAPPTKTALPVDFPDGPVVPPVLLHPALDTLGEATGLDAARSVPQGLRAGRGVVLAVVDADFDLGHPRPWPRGHERPPRVGPRRHHGPLARRRRARPLGRHPPRPRRTRNLGCLPRRGHPMGCLAGHCPRRHPSPSSRPRPRPTATRCTKTRPSRVSRRCLPARRSRASPAVVLLSLGSHRGAHDGQSALERGLAALTADGEAPGRVVVTSAGNDGAREVHARAEGRGAEGVVALGLRVGARPAASPEEVLGLSLRIPRDGGGVAALARRSAEPLEHRGAASGMATPPRAGGTPAWRFVQRATGWWPRCCSPAAARPRWGRMGGDYTPARTGRGHRRRVGVCPRAQPLRRRPPRVSAALRHPRRHRHPSRHESRRGRGRRLVAPRGKPLRPRG
jgi:hypothetical protein